MLCDPGSELRIGGRENRKGEDNKWDGNKKKKKLHVSKKEGGDVDTRSPSPSFFLIFFSILRRMGKNKA